MTLKELFDSVAIIGIIELMDVHNNDINDITSLYKGLRSNVPYSYIDNEIWLIRGVKSDETDGIIIRIYIETEAEPK